MATRPQVSAARTVSYSASNHPVSIAQGTRTVGFELDTDGRGFDQAAPEGTTLYFEAFGARAELLARNQWTEYLSAG